MGSKQSLPTPKVQRLPLSPSDQAPVRKKRGSYFNLASNNQKQGAQETVLSRLLGGGIA